MGRRRMRPRVDDDEWHDADNFGALKRRATAANFRSRAFKAEVARRNADKSARVLRRAAAQMGEPRAAASALLSCYNDQWSRSHVPMHVCFDKTSSELREERATIACHNSTLMVLRGLLARKERKSAARS